MKLVLGSLAAVCLLVPGFAQGQENAAWQDEKCSLYEKNWASALEFFGSDNINYNFMASNENFIAGGCTKQVDACPRSDQELEIANALTLAMMNAGTASTFLPFRCAEAQ
jgi:hypothetical protein